MGLTLLLSARSVRANKNPKFKQRTSFYTITRHFLEFVQLENFAKNYTNNNPKENAWISIAVNLVVVFAQVFHFRIWVLCLKRKKDVQIK